MNVKFKTETPIKYIDIIKDGLKIPNRTSIAVSTNNIQKTNQILRVELSSAI